MPPLTRQPASLSFTGNIAVEPPFSPPLVFAGIEFDLATVAALCGAPDGATVQLGFGADYVNMHITHPCFLEPAEIVVYMIGNGAPAPLMLRIENVEVAQQGTGVATRMVARMAQKAQSLGITQFSLTAVNNMSAPGYPPAKNGTYAWIKLGFDGPLDLEDYDYKLATPGLAEKFRTGSISTVAAVLADPEGPEFWRKNDRVAKLSFDLRSESLSWKTLTNRLAQKNFIGSN